MSGLRRLLAAALLMTGLVFLLPAQAEPVLAVRQEQAGNSYMAYPQLEGMDNTFIQDTINTAVTASLSEHFNTLKVLASGVPGQLVVDSEAAILPSRDGHDVLSILLTAEGRMPQGRNGYSYLPLQFDLANGQALGADAIFQDKNAAAEWLLEDLNNHYADGLSNYLDLSGLSPFPIDRMLLFESGVTFYYPDNQMTLLSGKPAAIHYLYHEMKDILNLDTGSALVNLGTPETLMPNAKTAEKVSTFAAQGKLPGLPVHLGDQLDELINAYHLQYDAEGFPGGEKYQLEDDVFRGTTLLSYDGATLNGLLSTRMNLGGLITGLSDREAVLAALGQPLMSLPLTVDAAAVYGLPEGSLDNYQYGENVLKLYYDSDSKLYAFWLEKGK